VLFIKAGTAASRSIKQADVGGADGADGAPGDNPADMRLPECPTGCIACTGDPVTCIECGEGYMLEAGNVCLLPEDKVAGCTGE